MTDFLKWLSTERDVLLYLMVLLPVFVTCLLSIIVYLIFKIKKISIRGVQIEGSHSNEKGAINIDGSHEKINSNILGVWTDSFDDKGTIKISLISISQKAGRYVVEGFEYNQYLEKTFYWNTDVTRYRDDQRKLEYLFKATKTDERINREIDGFTSLKFPGTDRPTGYIGYFVDIIDVNPKHPELRNYPLEGIRIEENMQSLYNSEDGRRILVKQQLEKKHNKSNVPGKI